MGGYVLDDGRKLQTDEYIEHLETEVERHADLGRELYEALKIEFTFDCPDDPNLAPRALARYEREVGENEAPTKCPSCGARDCEELSHGPGVFAWAKGCTCPKGAIPGTYMPRSSCPVHGSDASQTQDDEDPA